MTADLAACIDDVWELVEAIGHYKDFLHEWGFLASNFDIDAWVDHRPWALLETRAVA